jgi:hypothetical protein
MWKQRVVSLCGCFAALLLLMGCASGVGAPSQANAPPAPAAASSADTGGARAYAVGPGEPAAILVMRPKPGDILTGDPQLWARQGFDVMTPAPAGIYRIAADQEAAMTRLIDEAQAMANAPVLLVGANPAIEAAMASMPPSGPGRVAGVIVTSMTSGASTCSKRMTYFYSGNGAPKVSVSKSGDCPAGSAFGSFGVGNNPAVAPPMPAVRPNRPRVIEAAAPAGLGSPAAVRQVAELIKSGATD